MRYSLRTLLIVSLIAAPALAGTWWFCRMAYRDYRIWRAWEEGRSYPGAVEHIDHPN